MAQDIIFLKELKIETIIGIYEWERDIKQTVSIDLEMAGDVARAAATDAIADTLNYKKVAKRLIEFVGESKFQLVESLAERIADILLNEFVISFARVRVSKPGAIRGATDVGVLIERSKSDG